MDDVLKVYARPYDPRYPVVCMDEASRQLTSETRAPFVDSHAVTHIDNEYVRHGQQSIFLATEPLGQWRAVRVTDRRGSVDCNAAQLGFVRLYILSRPGGRSCLLADIAARRRVHRLCRDEDMLPVFPACRSSMFPEFGRAFPRVSVWTTLLLLMYTIARD